MENSIHIIDGNRGIYIPQEFAKRFGSFLKNEDKEVLLSGPDHPDYWEAWDDVIRETTIEYDGLWYTLNEEDGLFLIPIPIDNE